MKSCLLAALLAGILSLPLAATAQPYVGLNVGASIPSDSHLSDNTTSGDMSYATGFAVSGAAGLDFGLSRVELEIGYRRNDFDRFQGTVLSGTNQVVTYLLNGYLVAPMFDPIKPFVMAGAGLATMYAGGVKLGATKLSDSTSNSQFAYQAGLGVTYDVSREISLDASYRYLGTSDFDLNGTKVEYGSQNLLIGCRYNF